MDKDEEQKDDDEDSVGEMEKLREENKRLKKTLLDKFQNEGDLWLRFYIYKQIIYSNFIN